jgi:type I restriction enzyme S subunit
MRDANHTSEASRPLATCVAVDPESLPMGTAPNYTFRYIDIASATQGRLLLPDDELEYRDAPSRARRVLRDQDVIMSTVRPNLKAFAYCRLPPGNFVASTGFAVLRAKEDTDPRFILYSILSDDVTRQIERFVVGSNYPAINSSDVKRLRIPNLSPGEQARIGEIIGTVDEAIEQTEALIGKTQQIKAGLMHDLFTRGVSANGQLRPPREDAPQLYKESPLGWIPKEWDVRPLDKLADVNRGKFTIRPRNDPRYYNGQYPFIQTGDVALAGGRVLASYSQTLNSLGLGVSRLFPVGTIMVTIAANIADTCILGIPMCAPDSLVGVVPNAGEVARFLELCIRRRKRWFENRAPQTAQKNINLDDLRPMLVPYPAPDEQSRIAERYEAIDEQLLENEEAATKLGMFKRGLMQDLLSGAVPVAVEYQPGRKEVAANV